MKTLEVPEEISDLFDEAAACNQCRDTCISSIFKARRAIYYAKQAVKASAKAWDLARDLWPETREGRWSYRYDTKTIHGPEGSNAEVRGCPPHEPEKE